MLSGIKGNVGKEGKNKYKTRQFQLKILLKRILFKVEVFIETKS